MPDWTKSMKQTFEYYVVDPLTWMDQKLISDIIDSKIDMDSESETKGSASFTSGGLLGECYIRVYLITIQNGIREKFPLGTYLIQTPSYSFNGGATNVTLDAYTPLIELKEKMPELGYYIPKDRNVMNEVYIHISDNMRAPVIKTNNSELVPYDFISDTSDTWLSYMKDLALIANHDINMDEKGRILFEPKQITDTLVPVWRYDDDNSSILHPAISLDNDLYGIPNVVEVIYSDNDKFFYSRIVNDDINSPTSIHKRGREIVYRDNNPSINGGINDDSIRRYAEDLLREMSSLEYTITYTHGYCQTKVGDCVILNYERAGLSNVKARIISQSISCIPGMPVEEKAIFTNKLWG